MDPTNVTSLDTATIVLNALGWIVAGFVTLLGVLVAHWIQQHGEDVHEAEVTIYAPLRMEMLFLTGQKGRVQSGFRLWNEWGLEFQGIYFRGLLVPRRHEPLRKDVEKLVELRTSHNAAQQELQRAVGDSMSAVWRAVAEQLGSGPWDGPLTFFRQNPDAGMSTGLVQALALGRREDFVWQFNATVKDLKKGTDLPALTTSSDEFFEQADKVVKEKREDYLRSCDALLGQADHIKSGVERALQQGKFYR